MPIDEEQRKDDEWVVTRISAAPSDPFAPVKISRPPAPDKSIAGKEDVRERELHGGGLSAPIKIAVAISLVVASVMGYLYYLHGMQTKYTLKVEAPIKSSLKKHRR